MDNKVIDITVSPQRVGSDIMNTTHIRSVLEQAYNKVIKMLPENAKFNFYSELTLNNTGERAPRESSLTSQSFQA